MNALMQITVFKGLHWPKATKPNDRFALEHQNNYLPEIF